MLMTLVLPKLLLVKRFSLFLAILQLLLRGILALFWTWQRCSSWHYFAFAGSAFGSAVLLLLAFVSLLVQFVLDVLSAMP